MKSSTGTVITILITMAAMGLSCGNAEQAAGSQRPAQFLIQSVEPISIERASEVRVFVGDSLWEYINGGAELYHLYGFVEVATADYAGNDAEIVVDVYQFSSSDNAFGLYSQLKPDEPQGLSLGVDGFSSETNLIFVKGKYVVMITGFEVSDEVTDAVEKVGRWLEQTLPGDTALPAAFALFPDGHALVGSERIQAESFLGRGYLTDVYTRAYAFDSDTLTLFVSVEGSDKLAAWKAQLAESAGDVDLAVLPYEPNTALATVNSYYGTIVAGLKTDRLAGVINYSDKHRDFIAAWLSSMESPEP